MKLGPIEIGENVPDMVSACGDVLKALDRPIYTVEKTVTKTNKRGKVVTKTQKAQVTAAQAAALVIAYAMWKWYKAGGVELPPGATVPAAVAPLFGLGGIAATQAPEGILGLSGIVAAQPGGAGIYGLAGIITEWILRGQPQENVGVPLTTTSYGVESGGQGVVWS